MGLESGTYVSDLVATNPPTSDPETQGANHLQLVKKCVKNTLPNGSMPFYFPKVLSKTANYSVLNTDDNTLFLCDATGGSFTLTLPTPANAGWHIRVVKVDSSANTVTVAPPSGTISGAASIVLDQQWYADRFEYDGSNFENLKAQFTSGNLLGRYGGTSGQPLPVSLATGFALSSGGVLSFAPSSAGLLASNLTLVASVSSDVLTIAVKTLSGADPSASSPVPITFRDVNAALGDYVTLNLTAALSIAFGATSTGSTLGSSNATPFKIWIVSFNDGGTIRLGVLNCLSGTSVIPLQGMGIGSSSQIGLTGSNSTQTAYTNGAAVTAKAYTVLGYFTYETGSTLTTAGSYASAPSRLALYVPGIPLPGSVVQEALTTTLLANTTTNNYTISNTAPVAANGGEILSQAMTPTSSTSILDIDAQAMIGSDSGAADFMIAYLIQDSVTEATAVLNSQAANSAPTGIHLRTRILPQTNGSTTSKLYGSSQSGTTRFNGAGSSALLGGTSNNYLSVKEIVV